MLSTLLIIDKRKELSTKYKKSLENSETKVIIAKNLKDAFCVIQNTEPDLILVSDSIDEKLTYFCQKVRTLTFNFRPIIVALSKSAETSDRIEVLNNGADDFISEPVNIEEFKTRVYAHLRRDIESNLDTKTLLPNKKYVYKALKRILNTEGYAVLLATLEEIENYKKVYTELASDKLIQTFVAIIKSSLNSEDFVGQISDYKFIIITNKYNAEKLAEFITFAFDTVIPKFYSNEDNARGYMVLKGNKFADMRVNFTSVLIGVIIDDFKLFTNEKALLDKLITIQKLAKCPNGSNYIIDRIKLNGRDSIVESTPNRAIYIRENDTSLHCLLRTTLELHGYDVQEDLDIENTVQPAIIILDSKDDLSELQFLQKIKKLQNFVNTKIIVTTSIHDKTAVLNAGADLYLPKPYEISEIIYWIKYFLK